MMRYQLICIRRPSKLSGSLLFGMAILLAWIVIAPSQGLAQSDDKITRVIELEPVEGSGFLIPNQNAAIPPQVTVTIHAFGGDAAVNFKLIARPLRQVVNAGSYALYVTTDASLDEYMHGVSEGGRSKFNTNFTGTINVWVAANFQIGVDDPQITAFIVFDPDDGRAFDPIIDSNRFLGNVGSNWLGRASMPSSGRLEIG
jgi:hypothetical protein